MGGGLSLLLGCVIWAYTATVHADAPTTVSVEELAELALYPTYSTPAEVVSLNDSRLSAQIQAVIKDIPVKVGQLVVRDAVLVELDCRDYQLALRQAEAGLKAAKSRTLFSRQQQKRAESLRNTSSISEELALQRETDLSTAQADEVVAGARLEQARLDVSRCVIRAPFNGVVLERLASVGETARPGYPLVRVLDRDAIEVSAQVSIADALVLEQATDQRLVTQNKEYALKLSRIAARVDTRTRSRDARLDFVQEVALPGTPGRLMWSTPVPHVPADILVTWQGRMGVFVVAGDRAKFVALPEALEGRPVALDIPLSSLIIVKGQRLVQDGHVIEVNP